MNGLLDRLQNQFDNKTLLIGENIGEKYCADWSEVPAQKPIAVLRPTTTEQVSEMIRICYEWGQPVVTQGGMTGLAGAAIPRGDEIVLSLERMAGIEEIDTDSMCMTVLAGTSLELAQEAVLAEGFYLALDLGARGSCTIGGNVATNAGGSQVVRYGMTRNLVLGLEVVLADGRIISSLNKVIKNNTGYDLKQLFIGSEGTLGIVTRVVLKLHPRLPRTYTALCATADLGRAIAFFKQAQTELAGGVCAFEVMWASYYDFIVQHVEHIKNPFEQAYPIYVLLQYQGADNSVINNMFEEMLFSALEKGVLRNALIAQSNREADAFWQIRDGIGDVISSISPVVAFDISIPIKSMQVFVAEVEQQLKQELPDERCMLFGHIGDSNLHLAVRLSDANHRAAVSALVYQKVGQYQGSISAEHGIGMLKKKYLSLSRSAEEIALMKEIKQMFDPKQILNRGRIF
ncbi:MAG: FAD-binding oxidoreductase [Pseudomonadales bacterium]|nr:FAD-binding oxidoreductase [Pseudomonadales bacterium]